MIKRCILICGFLASLLLVNVPLHAQYESNEYKVDLHMGFWFGPVAPFPGTELSSKLGTYLGGGGFVRGNLPWNNFKAETGIGMNDYRSEQVSSLFTMPWYVAVAYKVPLQVQLELLFKLGAGASYVRNYPEQHENILPLGYLGLELSFAAGRKARIGLRVDYNLLYEQHLSIPPDAPANFQLINGHMINIGLMLTFKVGKN